MSIDIAVLGHSWLCPWYDFKVHTEEYLAHHPRVNSYFVLGESGLRYDGMRWLLDEMHRKAPYKFKPTSILLLLGDNDLTYRDGRPRMGMDVNAFPTAFHESRKHAVALCETVAGEGRVCSTVPYPRFQVRGSQLVYNPDSPYNKMAGYYIKQLPIFRPNCCLPFVRQNHRVPCKRGRLYYPRKPAKHLYNVRDGIHPAPGSFDKLFKPVLEEWIARC